MSLETRVELVFDVDAAAADRALLPHAGGGVPDSAVQTGLFAWVSGDACPIRIFLWKNSTAENQRLPSGYQVHVFGQADSDAGTEETLFESTAFAEINLGTEEAPLWAYDVELSLATTELEDALGGEKDMTARVDVELAVAGGARPKTGRLYPRILRQAYSGNTPTPADPELPAPESIVTKIRGTIAIGSGDSAATVEGLALGAVPAQVLLTLRKPSAGDPQISVALMDDSLSDEGFGLELGAATPKAGYKVDYLIIMP